MVLDLYSRRVVGWSMGTRLTTDLVLRALWMAELRRKAPAGLIFHSDRGPGNTPAWRFARSCRVVDTARA